MNHALSRIRIVNLIKPASFIALYSYNNWLKKFKLAYMEFIRKTIILVVLFQLGACVGGVKRNTTAALSAVVQSCSAHHKQSNTNFFVVDASQLEYFIVVSGESMAANGSKNYCHISKFTNDLVYANGRNPYVEQGEDSEKYQAQYAGIANGTLTLGKIELLRYKFISGQWRYIESKKLSS